MKENNFKYTIQDLQKFAEEKGGKCFSERYEGAHLKYKWQCKEGHIWEATWGTICYGHKTWCPICARKLRIENRSGPTARRTIEEMQQIAESRGGKCLSEKYINSTTKLKWQCSKGHIWEAQPANIKTGTWCPVCSGRAWIDFKYNIQDLQKFAEEKGGKCLSEKYLGPRPKYKWQCKEGHIWEAAWGTIRYGQKSWCPKCSRKFMLEIRRGPTARRTLKEMQQIAEKRQGKCLSQNYLNMHTKLKWQCAKGHIWEAQPAGIKISGTWCPVCNGGVWKDSLNDLKNIAESRGGKCLSEKYINSTTKLKWKCAKGHVWEAQPANIKAGNWCILCYNESQRVPVINIKDLQILANKKGGKCLSKEYIRPNVKLKWQCKEGHMWEAVPNSIKMGTWCPICSEGISERICNKFFERIFLERFPKKRPAWLVGSSGYRLELDGYCKKLNLAFEYQGKQHYEDIKYFRNKGKEYIKKRIIDDKIKSQLCKEKGIVLIEVPYTIEFKEMKDYILQKAIENEINIPNNTKDLDYQLWDIYSPEKIKEMKLYAESKEGKCLSTKYIDTKIPLKWQCKEGHIWYARPGNIFSGRWCPICAHENSKGSKIYSLDSLKDVAKNKGGELLSTKFTNIKSKYKWKCRKGHVWDTNASSVLYQDVWCPICVNERKKIPKISVEDAQVLAYEKGGKCLSKEYIRPNVKLKWQCKEGHIWESRFHYIKQGRWCPICAKNKRLTIEDIKNIAKKKGGKCLSEKYINNSSKLTWQCKEGHTWEAIPYSIQRGNWCPSCSKNKRLTIEDMNKLAESKDGKCLSEFYLNAHTRLKWKCKEGHTWEAIPDSINRGSWCPLCSKKKKHKK